MPFGLQFAAGLSAGAGFLVGLLLLGAFAGHATVANRVTTPQTKFMLASLLGLALGAAWTAIASASYA